jgi:hypothetical protein
MLLKHEGQRLVRAEPRLQETAYSSFTAYRGALPASAHNGATAFDSTPFRSRRTFLPKLLLVLRFRAVGRAADRARASRGRVLWVAGDIRLSKVPADIVTIEARKRKIVYVNAVSAVTGKHVVPLEYRRGAGFQQHAIRLVVSDSKSTRFHHRAIGGTDADRIALDLVDIRRKVAALGHSDRYSTVIANGVRYRVYVAGKYPNAVCRIVQDVVAREKGRGMSNSHAAPSRLLDRIQVQHANAGCPAINALRAPVDGETLQGHIVRTSDFDDGGVPV